MRLTPKLSHKRANSVCGSWQSWTLLVHCADDDCLAQDLVRDELPRPDRDSECDTTIGNCRGFGHAPHVAGFSTRMALHPDHSRGFRSDSGVGDVEERATPGLGGT